jgi:hypothetical protein
VPRPCYSTIFEQPAAHVWSIIRDFGHYSWAGVTGETGIEGSKSGDQVGCVRAVQLNDRLIRQRLLTLSDHEWWFSYELCEPAHLPLRDYIATLRVTPITDG